MIKSKGNTLISSKKLYFKRYGYHHNLSRCTPSFGNIDHNSQVLSRQSNVPSNFSTRSTNHSFTSSIPATPMAPTPSTHAADFKPAANQPVPRQPVSNHTCTSHMDEWVINLSKTPLTKEQLSLLQKGPNYAITPKYPTIEAYITSTEQAANKLPSQEADELRSDVNRILKQLQQQHNKQCNLNPPVQSPHRTQTGQFQGGFSWQTRGWPWSSWTNRTTLTKHKHYYRIPTPTKCSPRTPPPSLKTNSLPFLKTLHKQEVYPPKKYKQLYPTSAVPPKFYGLPKIHKVGTPLRAIVSSRGQSPMGLPRSSSTSSNPL